jgi:hypothetical protein
VPAQGHEITDLSFTVWGHWLWARRTEDALSPTTGACCFSRNRPAACVHLRPCPASQDRVGTGRAPGLSQVRHRSSSERTSRICDLPPLQIGGNNVVCEEERERPEQAQAAPASKLEQQIFESACVSVAL